MESVAEIHYLNFLNFLRPSHVRPSLVLFSRMGAPFAAKETQETDSFESQGYRSASHHARIDEERSGPLEVWTEILVTKALSSLPLSQVTIRSQRARSWQ
jgi:hypothetical protein